MGATAELQVAVLAPSWIRPEIVRILGNGDVLQEREVREPVNGIWFEETIPVDADSNSWFAVEVDGDASMGHIWGDATPYAITSEVPGRIPPRNAGRDFGTWSAASRTIWQLTRLA